MPAVLLVVTMLASQAVISPHGGRVVDSRTGAPVPGATVAVVGTTTSARTDADGRFAWTVPPPSPSVAIVTLWDGRVMKPLRFVVDPAASLTFVVEPAVSEIVTVSATTESIDVSPEASTTFLGRDEIALRHPATLVQVLEAVPGVGFIAEGQAAVPAIRSQARGRTLILVDGTRAGAERRAGSNASFIDPGVMRSVEVARGPGSVAYGSEAIGGVIAVATRGPDRRPGWHGHLAGTLGAGVPERRGEVEIGRGHGSGAVLVGLRLRTFGDYAAPGGRVPNSGWEDAGVRLAWEQETRAGRLSARWHSDAGRDLGRPRSDSDATRVVSPVEDSHRLTLTWERATAGAWRGLRVDALVGSARQQIDQDRLAAGSRARSLESSETTHRDTHVRATAERAVGTARLSTGADLVGRYGLRTIDTVTAFTLAGAEASQTQTISIDRAHRTNVGAFVDASWPLGSRWHASGGARIDIVDSRSRGGFWGDRSMAHAAMSGVATISASIRRDVVLTAQVARGFRDATLSDRFYRGPVGRGVVEGNPDLVPETSLQFDMTARLTRGRVIADIAAYRYDVSDLIERYAVNATLFRFRNRGEARFTGVEASASIAVWGGLRVEASVHTSRGRDAHDGTPLDDVAPASVALTGRYTSAGPFAAYVRTAAYGRHDDAGPSEVPTPGYAIVDLGGSWRVTSLLTLQAVGRNLFDARHYGSAGPRWVYAPGRAASLTFTLTY